MKSTNITCSLAIGAILLFTACKTESDAVRDSAAQQVQQGQSNAAPTTAAPSTAPTATTPEPAQNSAGVWHYTCPKGCAGGAGSAVACAKCGTTLAHNQAYHAGGAPATPVQSPPTLPKISDRDSRATSLPPGMVPVESPLKSEAAQNAKGVWHYTCPKGCAGGAGLAIGCPKCGTTLAHNQAYHQ